MPIPGWDGKFAQNWRTYTKEHIRNLYNVSHQRTWRRNFGKRDVLWIIENIKEWPDVTLMDVGCSKGQMAAFLYRKGLRKYCGLDVSDVAIEKARKRISHLNWEDLHFYSSYVEDWRPHVCSIELYPGTKYDFAERYDIVLCSHTLEHLVDIKKGISNMKAMARKAIAIIVPMQMRYGGCDYHTHIFPSEDTLVDLMEMDTYKIDVRTPKRGRRIIRYIGYVS